MESRDIYVAKTTLQAGGYTCVLVKGEKTYTSCARGVKPLVAWHEEGMDFRGYSAADKVVGRATAFLYVRHGVMAVHAGVISRSALAILEQFSISASYDTLVDHIINRTGDGICPFEGAVLSITDPDAAYKAIQKKMEEMHIYIS